MNWPDFILGVFVGILITVAVYEFWINRPQVETKDSFEAAKFKDAARSRCECVLRKHKGDKWGYIDELKLRKAKLVLRNWEMDKYEIEIIDKQLQGL